MAPLTEPMYSSQHIKVPPALPDILKQYTKAAIRTQPHDLVSWSASYFRAMANGEKPPVKERLEMSAPTEGELSLGILKVLHSQLGSSELVAKDDITQKWLSLGLDKTRLDELILKGGFDSPLEWQKLMTLAVRTLEQDVNATMQRTCELLTPEPTGGSGAIPYDTFASLYTFLATVEGQVTQDSINAVLEFLREESKKQDGQVLIRNLQHPACPSL